MRSLPREAVQPNFFLHESLTLEKKENVLFDRFVKFCFFSTNILGLESLDFIWDLRFSAENVLH